MADDDLAPNAKLFQEAREAKPQRLRAHEVDLLFEQPTRIIFAKAGRFDHRLRFNAAVLRESLGSGLGNKTGLSGRAWEGLRAGLRGPCRPKQQALLRPKGRRQRARAALEPECANC